MVYKQTACLSARLTLIGLLPVLAACGGDSKQEEACDQMADGKFFIINGIMCVFGTSDAGTAKPSGSGTTSLAADSPAFGNEISEYEPNTLLDNANPLLINDAAIAVVGNLTSSHDAADNFVFTPNISGAYQVYLCADSCDQVRASGTLNLMVLDQSQTTIAATSLGPKGEKTLTIHLNAGIAYYTEVSTFGSADSYRLAIAKID
jgi:hypothetical protein